MIAAGVFLLSLAFVLYILAGYPLLLLLLSRKFPRPIRRASNPKPVSVLIAVHNGEEFLEAKIRSLFATNYPRELLEVFILSDGSTDRTEEIARTIEGVKLIVLSRQGKASALNAGMAACTGEVLLFTDVRQELHPDSIRLLLECLSDPEVGVVSGALVIRDPSSYDEANTGLYWRYEFWIRDKLSSLDSIFGATGALYAVRRELAVPIPSGTLLDDMYLPLAAFFRGFRLVVEPRAKMYDYPTALDTEFRRKVRTLAGNYQILRAYPQLLTPANRLWWHFLSYKFGRLVLPFALIAILVSSILLPSPWWLPAFGVQVLFYGLAVLDYWIPGGFLKRISSPVRTFVTLMGASLLAVLIFFVPSERLWQQTRVGRKA